uniref:NADH-ubiquinone oxidoreductase chain 3 n=1 Tax=Tegula lividomaculata TaxID=1764038 RepID=A0A109PQX0_9VEST|nr:NADH dehydrogenase subunit 3 [Tegula lividomaculata]AMA07355.1 NADH dehydrogenase subunit 3 [Tegula lividomaculata]
MLGVQICSLIAFVISVVVMGVAWVLGKRSILSREKSSPFECGFDPMGSARLPFSLRFFLLAVIFLIFDVEIVLLFPFVVKACGSMDLYLFFGVSAFLLILILGLFHEWREGSLDWMT